MSVAASSATVKGGFWETNGVATLAPVGRNSYRRRIAQFLGRKSTMDLRKVLEVLDGAVAGSNATKTLSRVAPSTELGGVRAIETQTLVNRNTTAGDVTTTKADLLTLTTRTTYGSSPKANLDGNPLGTR